MDYVEKYLHVDKRPIGYGGFGRVLAASPLVNQPPQTSNSLVSGSTSPMSPLQQSTIFQNKTDTNNTAALTSTTTTTNTTTTTTTINNITCSNVTNNILNATANSMTTANTIVTPDRTITSTIAASPTGSISPRPQRLALKWLHSIVRPNRLANELRCLRDLGGKNNVVRMHTAHLHMGSLFIVMDLIEHNRFSDIVVDLYYPEIVIYMKNLLIALEHVHGLNIVHRDIKPTNFLYNRKQSKFLLVDFGLAQVQRPKATNLFNATPHQALSGNGLLTTGASRLNAVNGVQPSPAVGASPKTPTSLNRRPIGGFSIQLDPRRQVPSTPFVAPMSATPSQQPFVMTSPPKAQLVLKDPNTPVTPNVSTKRLVPADINTNEVDQTFKRLRVSNCDEIREPVKLTVGAYESPVTNNEGIIRTRVNANQKEQHKFSTPKVPKRNMNYRCGCYGRPRTCSLCMNRKESNAPRSGTSGFKAPETLLRSHHQTTAIDVWAAGVVMMSLLAGNTPIFRNVDDTTSLAEVITIFGSQRIKETAQQLRIKLTVLPQRAPHNLAHICRTIRANSDKRRQFDIPDDAFDLLNRMLDPNPLTRITASQALQHAMFNNSNLNAEQMES